MRRPPKNKQKYLRRAPKPRTLIALNQLERLGVFVTEDATRLGISQPTLSRLVSRGIVKRVGRGFYTHRYSRLEPKYRDFAMACRKFGYRAAIGGPSALYFHGLIPKVPKETWVLVGYNQKTISPRYRCLRASRKPLTAVIDQQHFRVTSLDRTLVECLRHAGKVGKALTLRVVHQTIQRGATSADRLLAMCVILNAPKSVRTLISRIFGRLTAR